MSRIKTYDNDATLNAGDRLLGTDVLNNSTKNFTLESLAEFINGAPGGGGTGGNPITAATFTKSGDRVTLTLTPTTGDPIVASFIEDLNEGTIHTGSLDPVTAQVSGSPGDFYIQRDTTGDTPIVNFYGPLVRATTATDFSSWNNVGPQTLIGIQGEQGDRGFQGDGTEVTSVVSGANPGDTSSVTFTNTDIDTTAGTSTTSTETVTIQPGVQGDQGIGINTITAPANPTAGATQTVTVALTDPSGDTTPSNQVFQVPSGAQGIQGVGVSDAIGSIIADGETNAGDTNLTFTLTDPLDSSTSTTTAVRVRRGGQGVQGFKGDSTEVTSTSSGANPGDTSTVTFTNTGLDATAGTPTTSTETVTIQPGVRGVQGVQGLFSLDVYTISAITSPPTIAPTGGVYTLSSSSITTEPTSTGFTWTSDVPTGLTAGQEVYISRVLINPSSDTAATISLGNRWAIPFQAGAQGATGSTGARGSRIFRGTGTDNVPTTATDSLIGDYFFNATNATLYGPATAVNTFPATGTLLRGDEWFTTSTQFTATTIADVSAFTGVRDGDIILVSTGTAAGNLFEVSSYSSTTSTATLTAAGNIRGAVGMAGTNGTAVLNGTVAPTDAIGNSGDFYVQRTTNSRLLFGPKDEAAGNQWGTGVELVGEDGDDGTTWFTTATQLTATAGVDVSSFTGIIDGDIILINSGAGVGNLFTISAHDATANTATLTADGNIRGATGSAGDDGTTWFTTATQLTATTGVDVSAFTGIVDGDIILVNTGDDRGNLFTISAHSATANTATLTASGNIRGAMGGDGSDGTTWFSTATQIAPATGADVSSFTGIVDGDIILVNAGAGAGNLFTISAHDATANTATLTADGNIRGAMGMRGFAGDDGTTWFTTATQLTATTGVDVSAFTGIVNGDIILVNTGAGGGNLFIVSAHDAAANTATLTANGNIRGTAGSDGTTWFSTPTQFSAGTGVNVSALNDITDGDIILVNTGDDRGNLFTVSAHSATANTATLTASGNIRGADGGATDGTDGIIPFFDTTSTSGLGDTSTRFFPSGMVSLDPNFSALTVTPSDGIYTIQNGSYLINDGGTTSAITNLNNVVPLGALTTIGTNTYMLVAAGTASFDLKRIANTAGATALATGVTDSVINPTAGNVLQFNFSDTFNDDGAEFSNERLRVEELFVEENTIVREDVEANSFIARTGVTFSDSSSQTSAVAGNPTGGATVELEKVFIEGVIYSIGQSAQSATFNGVLSPITRTVGQTGSRSTISVENIPILHHSGFTYDINSVVVPTGWTADNINNTPDDATFRIIIPEAAQNTTGTFTIAVNLTSTDTTATPATTHTETIHGVFNLEPFAAPPTLLDCYVGILPESVTNTTITGAQVDGFTDTGIVRPENRLIDAASTGTFSRRSHTWFMYDPSLTLISVTEGGVNIDLSAEQTITVTDSTATPSRNGTYSAKRITDVVIDNATDGLSYTNLIFN